MSFFGSNLVRWAGSTRWMVPRACWNGCSVGMLMTSGGSVFKALMTLGQNEYACVLMRAWICMYLFELLFRVQEHGVMMCCGNITEVLLYLVKEGELVLYLSCFKCFPAQFINQFCSDGECNQCYIVFGTNTSFWL